MFPELNVVTLTKTVLHIKPSTHRWKKMMNTMIGLDVFVTDAVLQRDGQFI